MPRRSFSTMTTCAFISRRRSAFCIVRSSVLETCVAISAESGNDLGAHRQLITGKTQSLLGRLLAQAPHLKDDGPRSHDGCIVFNGALPGAHRHLRGLTGDRRVREDTNPDFPSA